MDRIFFELQDAMQRPGCFLCHLEAAHEKRFLDTLFYEFVTDQGVRERLRTGGFCRNHAQKLFALRPSVLGMAIVYQDLLHQYLSSLRVPDPRQCLVCVDWNDRLNHLIRILTTRFAELEPFWGEETFVCLHHLAQFPDALRTRLEAATRKRLVDVLHHLSSFTEKFDYQKSGLPIEPREARSLQETMEFFSGKL